MTDETIIKFRPRFTYLPETKGLLAQKEFVKLVLIKEFTSKQVIHDLMVDALNNPENITQKIRISIDIPDRLKFLAGIKKLENGGPKNV